MTTRTTDAGASQQPTTRPDTKEELGRSSQVLSLSLRLEKTRAVDSEAKGRNYSQREKP